MSETTEGLIQQLRQIAAAYPEDIFLPLTEEQREQHALVITRASAAMGRHLAKWLTLAADEIERLSRAPEGWVLVPREPTDAMLERAESEYERTKYMAPDLTVFAIYKAMLSALPPPTEQHDDGASHERK